MSGERRLDVSPPTLTTAEAAGMLGISPVTLRMWERRYGWPRPTPRSRGGHRRYDAGDIESLAACYGGRNPRSAITQAQSMAAVYTICPHCHKTVDRLLVRMKSEAKRWQPQI